jgi:hypothetical protein
MSAGRARPITLHQRELRTADGRREEIKKTLSGAILAERVECEYHPLNGTHGSNKKDLEWGLFMHSGAGGLRNHPLNGDPREQQKDPEWGLFMHSGAGGLRISSLNGDPREQQKRP